MELKINSIYKHYKGNYYKTLLVCNDASNSKSIIKLVVYQSLYDDKEFGNQAIWARPLDEFLELHDGINPRFEFICQLPNSK